MQHMRILLFCALLLISLKDTSCDDGCNLRIGRNPPTVQRFFGRRTYFRKYHPNVEKIPLNDGETIVAFCEKRFMNKTDDYYYSSYKDMNVKRITFKCSSGSLKRIDGDTEYGISGTRFGCSTIPFSLFESNTTLLGCEDFMSYGIGAKSLPETNYSSIGLCYDLDTLSIKYAKYMAYPEKFFLNERNFNNTETIVELDTELNNLDIVFGSSFLTDQTFRELYNRKQTANTILQNHRFEFENLIQDASVDERCGTFEKLFNTMWWQDLRERNWRSFQNEFVKRNKYITYLVYAGVSGVVKLPSMQNSDILELSEAEKYLKAPAYIWMYLKTIERDVEEEFVIVGHNTPFHKTDAANFCEDICDEITWLKNSQFGRLHLIPVYGLVNCCRAEEVASKLDNFPLKQTELQKINSEITTEDSVFEYLAFQY